MSNLRAIATAAASLLAAVVVGCGVGEGEVDEGTSKLTVTRDFGAELLLEAAEEDPTAAQTVVRFLDREANIETSYGGNFVDSIEGIASKIEDGRTEDWFFYINGYWSPIGAGEAKVRAGDRIWWDYRDWTDAYRVPAVVGSWPEPFVHGRDGTRPATEVVCMDAEAACEIVAERLRAEGAEVTELGSGDERGDRDEVLSVLVGTWARVGEDQVAEQLFESSPTVSGVYARPVRCDGRWSLETLDDRGRRAALLPAAGWIAALTEGEEQPTWVVTGTEAEEVGAAAEALETEQLADRYAVAVSDGATRPLPEPEGAGGEAAEGCG